MLFTYIQGTRVISLSCSYPILKQGIRTSTHFFCAYRWYNLKVTLLMLTITGNFCRLLCYSVRDWAMYSYKMPGKYYNRRFLIFRIHSFLQQDVSVFLQDITFWYIVKLMASITRLSYSYFFVLWSLLLLCPKTTSFQGLYSFSNQ